MRLEMQAEGINTGAAVEEVELIWTARSTVAVLAAEEYA
jgi:hypothetical protein